MVFRENTSSCERSHSISRDANLEHILIMPYKRNVANAKLPVDINRTRSRMESFRILFSKQRCASWKFQWFFLSALRKLSRRRRIPSEKRTISLWILSLSVSSCFRWRYQNSRNYLFSYIFIGSSNFALIYAETKSGKLWSFLFYAELICNS